MSAFEYSARYDFPKMCVTFNHGTEYEFKSSIYDFYSNSLDALLNIDVHKCECIDMSKIRKYRRIISRYDRSIGMWIKVREDDLINDKI